MDNSIRHAVVFGSILLASFLFFGCLAIGKVELAIMVSRNAVVFWAGVAVLDALLGYPEED